MMEKGEESERKRSIKRLDFIPWISAREERKAETL
jgi:hypothetical protein